MSLFKTAMAGLVAAASILAASAGPATAAETKVGSEVHIKRYVYNEETDTVTFKGTVTSSKAFCENHRKVTLRQIDDGVLAGHATSRNGRWQVSFSGSEIEPGVFKATMERKVVKKNGKTYVCAADTDKYDAVEG